MNVYEKLDALVKKAEELDEIGDELAKVNGNKNPLQERCLSKSALQTADELEELGELLTDDDIAMIYESLSDEDLEELQRVIDENPLD